jgi:hypothetical protein
VRSGPREFGDPETPSQPPDSIRPLRTLVSNLEGRGPPEQYQITAGGQQFAKIVTPPSARAGVGRRPVCAGLSRSGRHAPPVCRFHAPPDSGPRGGPVISPGCPGSRLADGRAAGIVILFPPHSVTDMSSVAPPRAQAGGSVAGSSDATRGPTDPILTPEPLPDSPIPAWVSAGRVPCPDGLRTVHAPRHPPRPVRGDRVRVGCERLAARAAAALRRLRGAPANPSPEPLSPVGPTPGRDHDTRPA